MSETIFESNTTITEEARTIIVDKLKNALKEELNAWYGYIIVSEFLAGPERKCIVDFYKDTAKDELEDHAYWIMQRINELDGTIEDITVSPAACLSAEHPYIMPLWNENGVVDIERSLQTNIENEKGAIETYKELVEITNQYGDWTTNRKCKEILADEEEHLGELEDFVADIMN